MIARGRAPAGLLAAAMVLLLAAPALDPDVQLFYRDTGQLWYHYKQFIAAQLLQARSPFWDPWTEAGTSVLGQVTPGLFHPLTLLYLALPFELAFKLNHLAALPLAWAGAYLLCRRVGASSWASAAAACAYAGSGFVVSVTSSNVIWALAAGAVPLAVHGLLRFAERPGPGRLLWASYALALSLYGGEPQAALLAAVIGTVWLIGRDRSPRAAGLAASWGLCAVLLAAPAELPVLWRATHSSRSSGVTAADRDAFATAPARLAGLLLPAAFDAYVSASAATRDQPFTEYFAAGIDDAFADSIVLGAPALLLAFAGWRRGRWALAGAAFLLLVSTGEASGPQRALFALLPGMKLFRYPEKLILPASLLLCVAAALGADEILERKDAARRLLRRSAAGAVALIGVRIAVAHWPGRLEEFLRAHGRTHAVAPAAAFAGALSSSLIVEAGLAAAIAALALLCSRRDRFDGAAATAALVCAAAAVLQSGGIIAAIPLEILHGPMPLADELLSRAGPSEGRWRMRGRSNSGLVFAAFDARMRSAIASQQSLNPNYNTLARIEGVSEYTSLGDADYQRAYNLAPAAFSQVMGVRFDVRGATDLSAETAARSGYRRGPQGAWIKEFPERPRAFLAGCARAVPDAAQAVELLASPGFRIDEAVVRRDVGLPCPGHAGGAVSLERLSADRMRAVFTAEAPALLVFAEHYDPGWRASLDGASVEVVQVDLSAVGVAVPAGRHVVELRYWPEHLTLAFALAFACAAALAVLHALGRRSLATRLFSSNHTSRTHPMTVVAATSVVAKPPAAAATSL
jgi:hypothetical protein